MGKPREDMMDEDVIEKLYSWLEEQTAPALQELSPPKWHVVLLSDTELFSQAQLILHILYMSTYVRILFSPAKYFSSYTHPPGSGLRELFDYELLPDQAPKVKTIF